MFSHYAISILPFSGQDSNEPVKEKKSPIKDAIKPIPVDKKVLKAAPRAKVEALSSSYNSGNLGILETLSPRAKKVKANDFANTVDDRESFTEEQLKHQITLFAYKKKNEEGRDSLFSTLTSCKLTIHDQVNLKLHLLNAVQSKELNIVKMELLAFLRKELRNGAITFDHILEESKTQTVSFTDKKSQFDKLASENPSLEKFRKLFNLDIEY